MRCYIWGIKSHISILLTTNSREKCLVCIALPAILEQSFFEFLTSNLVALFVLSLYIVKNFTLARQCLRVFGFGYQSRLFAFISNILIQSFHVVWLPPGTLSIVRKMWLPMWLQARLLYRDIFGHTYAWICIEPLSHKFKHWCGLLKLTRSWQYVSFTCHG